MSIASATDVTQKWALVPQIPKSRGAQCYWSNQSLKNVKGSPFSYPLSAIRTGIVNTDCAQANRGGILPMHITVRMINKHNTHLSLCEMTYFVPTLIDKNKSFTSWLQRKVTNKGATGALSVGAKNVKVPQIPLPSNYHSIWSPQVIDGRRKSSARNTCYFRGSRRHVLSHIICRW